MCLLRLAVWLPGADFVADRCNPAKLSCMRDILAVSRRTLGGVGDMLSIQCVLECRVLVAFCEWRVPVQVVCQPCRCPCGRLGARSGLRHGGDHVDLD